MTAIDLLLTGAVVLALALAVRSLLRSRKNGGCCGSCAGCSQSGCARRIEE